MGAVIEVAMVGARGGRGWPHLMKIVAATGALVRPLRPRLHDIEHRTTSRRRVRSARRRFLGRRPRRRRRCARRGRSAPGCRAVRGCRRGLIAEIERAPDKPRGVVCERRNAEVAVAQPMQGTFIAGAAERAVRSAVIRVSSGEGLSSAAYGRSLAGDRRAPATRRRRRVGPDRRAASTGWRRAPGRPSTFR